MKIKYIILFLTCLLLLSSFTTPATACCKGDPPGECYVCEDTVWVQYGDCWGGCPECESCVSCYCECTSECCTDLDCEYGGEGCESCVDCICEDDDSKCPGECDTCDDGSCVDKDYLCSLIDCETCNDGECEDRCPALGKHCWLGTCVECRDILDCELCYKCEFHECVHPCDDECYYPKYCGSACACVECYPGEEDTTTCSASKSEDDCTGCSMNPISPCSLTGDIVVYTGNSVTSCTGPDCRTRNDVLCYTTYVECAAGPFKPFLFCTFGGIVGVPYSCEINLDLPVGCWPCSQDPLEEGEREYATRGHCPIEDWPE